MKNQFNPMAEVANIFEKDENLRNRLKTDPDPMKVIHEAVEQASEEYSPPNDPVLYRVAIGVLGILALLAATGALVLAFVGKQSPEALVSLGSAAVGALVGLFAPAPNNNQK